MLTVDFNPFPVLETERLRLRRINKNDASAVFALRSNPETMRYVPRPLAQNIDDALAHIALIDEKIDTNTGINWSITLKGSDEFIGIIGNFRVEFENYRAEIGYMLLPEFQGKGIVSEAIACVVQYGFREMKLHSIEAIIDPQNVASGRVLEKNGFVKEAHLRENEFWQGKFLDTVIYSVINPNDTNTY